MLIRGLLGLASPSGQRGRLSILIFHRVFRDPDPIFPEEMHARRFDAVCGWLRAGFNVLPLDQAVARLRAGSLPARAASITFDDGYADNFDVALPILRRHGLASTFFVATGFLDGGRMWNDTVIESVRLTRRTTLDLGDIGVHRVDSPQERFTAINAIIQRIKYLPMSDRLAATNAIAIAAQVDPPHDLMMTSTQVKALREAGMQIGAHTISHPILARLGDEDARSEIKGSKDYLEQLLQEQVGLFAYPNGKPVDDYNSRTIDLVRDAGFSCAVSTAWGAASSRDADIFQLPRFTPWDHTAGRFAMRMAHNTRQTGVRVRSGSLNEHGSESHHVG